MYIGNTQTPLPPIFIFTVYPYVYREHSSALNPNPRIAGLSLCIQGTYHLFLKKISIGRFIPVYTGNIDDNSVLAMWYTVYPCVYREHYCVKLIYSTKNGLSLCIQGTFRGLNHLLIQSRFIPVYTGNIPPYGMPFTSHPVYPCVYREHFKRSWRTAHPSGLSLCIQGTSKKTLGNSSSVRFIPVYTGNIHIRI